MTQLGHSLEIKSREIRVFLSSTFRDMEAERNYLMTYVFPDVRRYCNERQVAFTEIDLRWGVTEEESKSGRTVEICLEEIDRCREYPPFFIGFLGERYGWSPQPADMQGWQENNTDSPYMDEIRAALQQGISVTELEMQYAFLKYKNAAEYSRVFLRSAPETKRLYEQALTTSSANNPVTEEDFYDAASGKLISLKEQLRQNQCLSIDGYNSTEEFGKAVKRFLLEAVDRLFPAGEYSHAELQTRAHRNYAQSRRKAYVPLETSRRAVLASVAAAVKAGALDNTARHIAITGISGRGKSAFLADLEVQLSSQGWAFSHYTGADGNRSLENWLARLLDALMQTGKLITDLPGKTDERWQALYVALQETQAGLNQPIYLLVDAVNQCIEADAASRLSELKLPENVVLITTTTQDADAQHWVVHQLPALSTDHRQLAVRSFLSGYRKELASDLVSSIAADQATSEPLFLRLLLEELRLHARHETLVQLTAELLETGDAKTLFASVLTSMDSDYLNSSHKELASHIVRLLAASRRGLRHDDIAKLVAVETDQHDPADNRPRLADAILSPLLARLENFCLRDDGRLYIMHDALLSVAFYNEEKLKQGRQQLIAYFEGESGHSVAERVHQYRALQDTNGLVSTLGQLEATLSLWEYEPLLLRLALYELGAGKSEATAACEEIGLAWAEFFQPNSSPSKLAAGIGIWIMENGYYSLAERLVTAYLHWQQATLSEGHPDIAYSLNNLAVLYNFQGRLSEAEPLCQQALAMHQAALPEGDLSIAIGLNNLAALYKDQGRLKEAEPLLQQALAMHQAALPEGDLSIAIGLNNLAELYKDQGRLKEAEPLLQQVLVMRQAALPEGHPDIASGLNNLADLYQAQGRFDEAEPLCQQALVMCQAALPEGHPDIANGLNGLAGLYRAQGRLKEAESLVKQALAMRQAALPEGHPSIAISLNTLADLYQAQGRFDEAEPLCQQALVMRQAALLEGHPDIAISLNNLAAVYNDQGRLDDAEPLFQQALAMHQAALPEGHPYIATSLNNLAELYKDQGRFDEAEPLYQQALAMRQAALPEGHPGIATSLSNLAGLYQAQARFDEAEPLLQQALVMRQAALPEGHPDIANGLNGLAGLYWAQGRFDEAEPLLQEALVMRQAALPEGHPDIASSLDNLAIFYYDQGRLDDAEPLFQQALAMRQATLPEGHDDIAISWDNLASLNQGKSLLRRLSRFIGKLWR